MRYEQPWRKVNTALPATSLAVRPVDARGW
jgi:hypothetical protein